MINKARAAYIEQCKREFAEFAGSYKYMMRHVKKFTEININGEIFRLNGVPIGTVIVFYDEGELRVGFSKVDKSDLYNRHIGIIRAINDAYGVKDRDIPRPLRVPLTKMVEFAQSEKGQEILLDDVPMIEEIGGEG